MSVRTQELTYHAKEDAGAEEDDAVVLGQAAVGAPQPLGHEDAERREEPRDALLAGLFAVGHGVGGNVRQRQAGVDAGNEEGHKGDVERSADVNGVPNHAASCTMSAPMCIYKTGLTATTLTQVPNTLSEHDAALQHAEDGSAARRLDDFAGDDVDDEAAGLQLAAVDAMASNGGLGRSFAYM